MKVYLELEVDEEDLFITNQGIIPFKDITDGFLNIGKYQFRIRKDIEINCYTCGHLSERNEKGNRYCQCDCLCPYGFCWDSINDRPVHRKM